MLTPHLGGGPRKVTHQGWPGRAWDPRLPAPGPVLRQPLAVTLPGRGLHTQPHGAFGAFLTALSHAVLFSHSFTCVCTLGCFLGKNKTHVYLSQQIELKVTVQNKGCGPHGAGGNIRVGSLPEGETS